MGTYATTTSLDTLMVGTTFDTATTSVAGQCITWAEDEINKHLSKRYDTSSFSSSVPPMVTSLAEQLSLGYLYDQLSRGSKESQTRADRLIKRVMENLKALSDGKADLVDSSGSLISLRGGRKGVLSNTSGYTQTFNEDDPLYWKIDDDKLSDISDERD